MVRVARTLRNNGRQFWGCSKYKVRLMCLKKLIVICLSYRLIRQNLCFNCFVFNNRVLLPVIWCGVTTSSGVMKKLYDERDGIIAQQRMKIYELEALVRVMKKTIQFFLGLVIVIVVIFIVMVPVMLKNHCV